MRSSELERWLAAAAADGEMHELLALAEERGELPEDVLALFHAGLLSDEERRLVSHWASLNEENLRTLADFETDIEQAAAATSRTALVFDTLRDLSRRLADLLAPSSTRRLAYAAVTVALIAVIGFRVTNLPPAAIEGVYRPPTLERTRGGDGLTTVTLPDGSSADRVDPAWPQLEPSGRVERARWLRWTPVETATDYRVRLFAPSGHVLLDRTGAKAVLGMPWGVRRRLAPETEFLWSVEAFDASAEVLLRGVARFTLVTESGSPSGSPK